jgi:large subunit ribosomal protein L31
MKDKIHPEYSDCKVTCGCGESFMTRATKSEINVEICSKCHPFYTGKQKLVDTAGRVEKFQRRYGTYQKDAEEEQAAVAQSETD